MKMLRLLQHAAWAETIKRAAAANSQAGQISVASDSTCAAQQIVTLSWARLAGSWQNLTSAPKPKRKPSEKRVEAFTLTHAESTHLRNSSATSGSSAAQIPV